jgi:hypothetical protein
MNLAVKIGVGVALVTGLVGFLPALQFFNGGCFFEGVCGNYEDATLPFALAISLAIGSTAGFGIGYLIYALNRH